ncbi:1-acyl-sn-glycerol-3-phosphate acyltransferase [Oryzobacter sp. R7]|uniref:1-acyl-sn-glycerol-3-phosphate acyltransferase n=1 Tax=Oryzobacter faecalis TaxID=3388656 RepID=UPI00398D1D94
MATARRGALAAGAARASGERARRRSTPLIGADPVVPAEDATSPARPAVKAATKKTAPAVKAATKKTAPAGKAAAKKAPAKKAPAKKAPAKKSAPARKAAPRKAPATRTSPAKAAADVPAPLASEAAAPVREAASVTPLQTPPARRPHRPAPQVRSAPSRAASRQAGERRAGSATRAPASAGAGAADERRPRVDPRTKAARDAARPHLRIAEPPLDPTVTEAPSRTGLPLPDVADLLEGLVAMLRVAAESAGIAPEDVERRIAQVLAYIRRRVDGDYEVDDFGYDADFTEKVFYPVLRPIYRHWFRVEVRGIENIPAEGGALVVSNHSGTVAIDSLMVQLAIHDEHPQHRVMRALGADLVFQTPFLGTIARRSGSTLAANEDAERLFARGELVGVFPEGFKGVGKPFRERYKLQRFGRGGFVAAALAAEVPIIPCSVVGAEEIMPIIGNMGTVARLFGLPYAPITPTFPLLGPLGLIPLPSKWIIEFGAPIPTDTHGPGAADDPMLVFDLTDQVRETIQQTLYTLLMQRRSVFF